MRVPRDCRVMLPRFLAMTARLSSRGGSMAAVAIPWRTFCLTRRTLDPRRLDELRPALRVLLGIAPQLFRRHRRRLEALRGQPLVALRVFQRLDDLGVQPADDG